MKKADPLSEAEKALFRNAIKGTRPLGEIKTIQLPSPKPRVRIKPKPIDKIELSDPLPDHSNLPEVSAAQSISYFHSSLSSPVQRKLKQGCFKIEATLDLHGYTSAHAKQALIEFIHQCVTEGVRHLIIIHGKGRAEASSFPILKNKVNFWLREHASILAFTSALPKHGGTGAVYVLLKKTV